MKKNLLIVLSVLLFATLFIPGKQVKADQMFAPLTYDVSVTSNSTLIANLRLYRKYLLVINKSSVFEVKIASWSIKTTDTGGIPLNVALDGDVAGGSYEEAYYVSKSSWYAVLVSTGFPGGSATLSVTEKE